MHPGRTVWINRDGILETVDVCATSWKYVPGTSAKWDAAASAAGPSTGLMDWFLNWTCLTPRKLAQALESEQRADHDDEELQRFEDMILPSSFDSPGRVYLVAPLTLSWPSVTRSWSSRCPSRSGLK